MKDLLASARAALQRSNPAEALRLTSEILAADPDSPQAHFIRARAFAQSGEKSPALAAALDGLLLASDAPALAERLEQFMVEELLDGVESDQLAGATLRASAEALGHAPRIQGVGQLLAHLHGHDTKAAMRFGRTLPQPVRTHAALKLYARACLAEGRLGDAIQAMSEALTMQGKVPHADEMLVGMEDYRRKRREGLRDPGLFPPRHRLAVCAVLKDEGDDLAEWLAHHANLGVEVFYIYNNQSTDDTARILASLSETFNITVHDLPRQPAQKIAYDHFFDAHRFAAEWVALIDGDEFIVPDGDSLLPLLDRDEDCAAIMMSWAVFGTSGHEERPQGLCTEAFTRRARDDDKANRLVKPILRPLRQIAYLSAHEQLMLGRIEDAMGRPVVPMDRKIDPPRHEGLKLHHYALKSREQALRKLARGRPFPDSYAFKFRDESYISRYDLNDVEDRSAQRFAPAIRRRLAEAGFDRDGSRSHE